MDISRHRDRGRWDQMLVPGPTEIPVAAPQPVEQQAAGRIAAVGKRIQPQHQRLRHQAIQQRALPNGGECQADQKGWIVPMARGAINGSEFEAGKIGQPAVTAG